MPPEFLQQLIEAEKNSRKEEIIRIIKEGTFTNKELIAITDLILSLSE